MLSSRPQSRTFLSRLTFDRYIYLSAFLIGLPGATLALTLLWTADHSFQTRLTFTILLAFAWALLTETLAQNVISRLQTLSNLLTALREGDYSVRARNANPNDSLGLVLSEINTLSRTLEAQRLSAVEAEALLSTVIAEIDVAIFAFDAQLRVKLANRAAEKLFALPPRGLLGSSAAALGLEACLAPNAPSTISLSPPGGAGRFGVRRSSFREGGAAHQALTLTDLSQTLRNEERVAWQRLIRVLSHELNNSLTPIKSISGSLAAILDREPLPDDWRHDMRRGLEVVSSRSAALGRFMHGYARLARLPLPVKRPVSLVDLINRVAHLETRLPIQVASSADIRIHGDPDQLEQLLINLIRNAVDACLEEHGAVVIGWNETASGNVEIFIRDSGPGIANSANLFVPFFTTKPGGSGIGLALCRQIAEAHDGTISLVNRHDAAGCEARLTLPGGGR